MVLGFGSSKKKILIVDDHDDQRTILKSLLEKQGYKVVAASGSDEAIQLAQEENPNLILMDINMPGMRGDIAVLRIKSEPKTKQIPVIMLTAVSDVQEKILASQAGAIDYVTKPYKTEELLVKITAHLK